MSTAATPVVEACQESQELTVEAWVTPAVLSGGDQTIAMLGRGDQCQAFALHQAVDRVAAALSSDETDGDGAPNIDTPDGSLGTDRTHVVLTRSVDGWRRLYLDGRLVSESQVVGDFSTWDPAARLAVGRRGGGQLRRGAGDRGRRRAVELGDGPAAARPVPPRDPRLVAAVPGGCRQHHA